MSPKKSQRRQFKYSRLNDFVHRIIDWMGSVQSLIVHTLLFIFSFSFIFFGYSFGDVLLVLTTIVSLEAIYMAIFIQIAVNQNSQSLGAVEEDIDEIQEDVEEIQEDVDEIQEDVEEIQEDVDEIEKDVDEMEKDDAHTPARDDKNKEAMGNLEQRLAKLVSQLEKMKDGMK